MKKVYLLVIGVLIAFASSAQIRHVRGVQSADLTYGISGYGKVIALSYVKYTSKKAYFKVGPFLETGNSPQITYTSFGIDAALNYTVMKVTEGIYVNLLAGATSSIDKLSDPLTLFDELGSTRNEDFSTLKFGLFGGLEVETFINDRFVVLLNFNERLMIKENFGRNRFFLSLGVRYNF
ncbi:MAG: conjugal transfer protein TraO [Cyclobacteriaceae bacterium]